jgi:hypothetical protein
VGVAEADGEPDDSAEGVDDGEDDGEDEGVDEGVGVSGAATQVASGSVGSARRSTGFSGSG